MITRNPLQQMSSLPAAEATVAAPLTRHLAGELYGVELRLADGLRVAGKPCDCLDNGRNLNLEATARKLTSLDPNNRVYREILDWIQRNRSILSTESVRTGQYDHEYPQMACQIADFRKRIMGTASLAFIRELTQPALVKEAPKRLVEEAKVVDKAQMQAVAAEY